MRRNKALATLLVCVFLLPGCLNLADPSVEVPDVELPEDWSSVVQRSSSSPQLLQYSDCLELEDALKNSIAEEYRIQLLQAVQEDYYFGGGVWAEGDDFALAESADSATSGGNAVPRRQQGTDFSGTNNQESGVDEADFVKTDGYFIYFLNGKYLEVFGTPEFGELIHLSSTVIEGNPLSMMLDENRLVTISSVSSWNIPTSNPLSQAMGWDDSYGSWRSPSLTKFTVLDLENRSAPEIVKELFIEGSYITAREVNGTVRSVSHAWLDIPDVRNWLDLPTGYWNLEYDDPTRLEIREKVAYQTILSNQERLAQMSLSDLLPKVYERDNNQVTIHTMDNQDCADFIAPEDGFNRGFNSIFTFDISSDSFEFQADHIVGNYPLVYASEDVLILTENAWDWWWFWGNDNLDEATNIHTFDISDSGDTAYTGSGRVNGTILNQFSLSEHEGVIRVAVTSGQWARWWMDNPEPMSSSVVTFMHTDSGQDSSKDSLYQVGRVDGIAPGERIWSARFDGDRCYLVTFLQIDPLWVIDMSNASSPTILGELEVPGVSTYIHPLSNDHLLTIGMGPADEDGTGLDWSSTRLSLFNISDPSTPLADDHLMLTPVIDPEDSSWVWSSSEASYEHKAFQYWEPKGLLAIPLSTHRYQSWTSTSGQYYWNYQFISHLVLVNVSEDTGNLSIHGTVDHSELYDRGENRQWWSEPTVRRSIFMGDFIYAVSSAGVTATNLTTMEHSAACELEYSDKYYHDYYQEEVAEAPESSPSSDGSEGGEGAAPTDS